jgi:hypothetical protein
MISRNGEEVSTATLVWQKIYVENKVGGLANGTSECSTKNSCSGCFARTRESDRDRLSSPSNQGHQDSSKDRRASRRLGRRERLCRLIRPRTRRGTEGQSLSHSMGGRTARRPWQRRGSWYAPRQGLQAVCRGAAPWSWLRRVDGSAGPRVSKWLTFRLPDRRSDSRGGRSRGGNPGGLPWKTRMILHKSSRSRQGPGRRELTPID